MDLIVDLALPQLIADDDARIDMESVSDPPVVLMAVSQHGTGGSSMIQLSFTRDQMREHIKRCQLVMGQLPA